MPNFMKKTSGPLAHSTNETVDAKALSPSNQKLGFLNRRQLSKHGQAAQVEVERRKIDAVTEQVIAINEVSAHMQGSLIRAEIGRVHSEQLAAISAVAFDNYKVMALEQAASRQAGTDANVQMHNEHVGHAMQRLSRGEVTQEQAEILANTAGALMVETETRIDARHRQLADATDRNFDISFAPLLGSSTRH